MEIRNEALQRAGAPNARVDRLVRGLRPGANSVPLGTEDAAASASVRAASGPAPAQRLDADLAPTATVLAQQMFQSVYSKLQGTPTGDAIATASQEARTADEFESALGNVDVASRPGPKTIGRLTRIVKDYEASTPRAQISDLLPSPLRTANADLTGRLERFFDTLNDEDEERARGYVQSGLVSVLARFELGELSAIRDELLAQGLKYAQIPDIFPARDRFKDLSDRFQEIVEGLNPTQRANARNILATGSAVGDLPDGPTLQRIYDLVDEARTRLPNGKLDQLIRDRAAPDRVEEP
jgi:hypothetical protein